MNKLKKVITTATAWIMSLLMVIYAFPADSFAIGQAYESSAVQADDGIGLEVAQDAAVNESAENIADIK